MARVCLKPRECENINIPNVRYNHNPMPGKRRTKIQLFLVQHPHQGFASEETKQGGDRENDWPCQESKEKTKKKIEDGLSIHR